MNATQKTTTSYKLPMLVETGWPLRPLTRAGAAGGWSVMECADRAHALEMMERFPAARMPCWKRIEAMRKT